MNNNYLKFTEGEITVYCGDHAEANVHQSLQQAREIAGSSRRGKILYINTIYTTRNLLGAARTELRSPGTPGEGLGVKEGIFFQHVIGGDLCKYLDEIRETIEANGIKYLIVNSWDFASRNYGFKEKALFGLMNIANDIGVSVIVYFLGNSKDAVAGKMHRGGLGKLAAIADAIQFLDSDEFLKEMRMAERKMKILSERKINELEYAHSETGVTSGGELVLQESEGESEVIEGDLSLV